MESSPWIAAHPIRPEQLLFRSARAGLFLPGDIVYRMGRDAMFHGLKALMAVDPRRTVLVPSFHCSSQIDAAQAAGLKVAFYPVRVDATVDPEQVAARITDDVLAAMVIHYYGWPLQLDGLTWVTRAREVALFEDCALALFSTHDEQPVGSFGALSIFSLRKSLPVLDGGILRFNRPDLTAAPPARVRSSMRPALGALARALGARRLVQWGKRLLGGGGDGAHESMEEAAPTGEPGPREPDFDVELSDLGISRFSRYIARRAHAEQVVERRRQAYQQLDAMLREHPRYRPLFRELSPGVCPLSLVIVHPRRDAVEAALLERNVETYCFGRVPHPALDRTQHPETAVLCDQTLALPVHQDLTATELSRVGRAVLDVL